MEWPELCFADSSRSSSIPPCSTPAKVRRMPVCGWPCSVVSFFDSSLREISPPGIFNSQICSPQSCHPLRPQTNACFSPFYILNCLRSVLFYVWATDQSWAIWHRSKSKDGWEMQFPLQVLEAEMRLVSLWPVNATSLLEKFVSSFPHALAYLNKVS